MAGECMPIKFGKSEFWLGFAMGVIVTLIVQWFLGRL
jgi:hypothetical protein